MPQSAAQTSSAAEVLPALVIDGVSKHFSVPTDKMQTLKERVLHPRLSARRNEFQALDDVSFHVEQGEFFGLVGRNGSGKSTLLKCIAGIYRCDGGSIWNNGRVASFIELGVGFNPELAAWDNVILNASLMGLKADAAAERYREIMDFAELWQFENLKLKNYSSGMFVRLAFSVMLQIDAEILLIDEVLAVGDASFQQKCFDEFDRMRASGRTIVFVSHGMESIKRFCDRAALLDHGQLIAVGEAEEIGNRYLGLNFSEDAEPAPVDESVVATLLDFWDQTPAAERHVSHPPGNEFELHGVLRYEKPAGDIRLKVKVDTDVWQQVAELEGWIRGEHLAGDAYEFSFNCAGVLNPGRYLASVHAWDAAGRLLFKHDRLAEFFVAGQQESGAPVELQPVGAAMQLETKVRVPR